MAFTFAHISDIHFGALALKRCEALQKVLADIAPKFVIISGDITMRAKQLEFELAKNFFHHFSVPYYIVPGNHDVPLHRFWERFFTPYTNFEKTFGPTQIIVDTPEYMLAGINTASAWQAKEGRLLGVDVANIESIANKENAQKLKIVFSHHPLPWIMKRLQLLGLYTGLVKRVLDCPIDLYLCGHHHRSRISFTKEWFSEYPGYQSLFFQAGTATCDRYRGENNAFYIYNWQEPTLKVDLWLWDENKADFSIFESFNFQRQVNGWIISR